MKLKILLTIPIILFLSNNFLKSETIDEIYAIVNDEIVTYSELKNFEQGMIQELKTKFSGEELNKQIKIMRKDLMDMIINRKLILSKAKEKHYDMTQYLKLVIKEIMKRNNFKTEKELISALNSQGISFEEFKKQRLDQLMQEKFIQEKIGSSIKVDSSEVVNYYRQNINNYKIPEKVTLNCIFLNKDLYFSSESRIEKMKDISKELNKKGSDFKSIAQKYSDLDNGDNRYFLGTFEKNDLDKKLMEAASGLKEGEYSDWITTDNGWYIIQLVKRIPEHVKDFKLVKENIKRFLSEKKRNSQLKSLINEIKKDSYIKILKKY